MRIKGITSSRLKHDPTWVEGMIFTDTPERFVFQAKVYDEGSSYGINGGRTSKLWIASKNGAQLNEIANYDRGWDHKPAPHHKHIVDAMVALLEMQDPITKTQGA